MAPAKAPRIDPKQLQGFKRLKHLLPLLKDLRPAGCERDKAGNRQLHYDEYVTLILFWLFNPLLESMRALQEAVGLEEVAEKLGVKRFSLGSFSESVRVFDPEQLKPLIQQLAGELHPVGRDPRLGDFPQVLTAVDGTVLNALSTVAAAWWMKFSDGSAKHAWRLHTHFDLLHAVPMDVELTDARCSGKSDEKNVLRTKLQADHCYILDRWFGQFRLFNDIQAVGSSYVCRIKENSVFAVQQERLLSEQDLAAGIVRDAVVHMGLSHKSQQDKPNHPIRLIVIEAVPHEKRGGRRGKTAGPPNHGTIVIATNLLEVPAYLIALIYQARYLVEIFFRFLKQILGCRHLLSNKPEGIQIQMYCAVIACMLLNLWTGKKPNRRTVEMMTYYFMGVAKEAELRAFLNRPDRTGVKLRAKAELWKKMGW
jgi:hypothetical protein